jgi:hypothetical protein
MVKKGHKRPKKAEKVTSVTSKQGIKVTKGYPGEIL